MKPELGKNHKSTLTKRKRMLAKSKKTIKLILLLSGGFHQ